MRKFLKDYTQTLENKLSSARTWSVNIIRCSQKIHRHLEMPKINSIKSCPLCKYDILAYLAKCQLTE